VLVGGMREVVILNELRNTVKLMSDANDFMNLGALMLLWSLNVLFRFMLLRRIANWRLRLLLPLLLLLLLRMRRRRSCLLVVCLLWPTKCLDEEVEDGAKDRCHDGVALQTRDTSLIL